MIKVFPDGGLDCESEESEILLEFDRWYTSRACEHEGGIYLHHRIGNIALVALEREELKKHQETFPIILNKVVYSGIHAGDYIDEADMPALQTEVRELADFKCNIKSSQSFIDNFYGQMKELIEASIQMDNPITKWYKAVIQTILISYEFSGHSQTQTAITLVKNGSELLQNRLARAKNHLIRMKNRFPRAKLCFVRVKDHSEGVKLRFVLAKNHFVSAKPRFVREKDGFVSTKTRVVLVKNHFVAPLSPF